MRRPRLRLTTRRLMLAVGALALILGGFVRFARRPYPLVIASLGTQHAVAWSDGSTVLLSSSPGRAEIIPWTHYWATVRWPDGSWSCYLHPYFDPLEGD